MIRQRPNLLLLDEPTNHLDLEMRQALSIALTDFSGALVVIAHDRHLLRTVCDELLLVHDGGVQWFEHSLDDYGDWLAGRQQADAGQTDKPSGTSEQRNSKRAQRQAGARAREALKPLMDRIRGIEKEMNRLRMEGELHERQLADESLYSDPARREELTSLVRSQAAAQARLAELEEEWLHVGEALERARNTTG